MALGHATAPLRVWVELADGLADDGVEPVEAPSEVHFATELDYSCLSGH